MNIGSIGDLHFPFTHPLYLEFCQDIFAKWRCNHIHAVGDIVDLHGLSFFDHDPNGMSAEQEQAEAQRQVDRWKKVFPSLTVCIGNHDERPYRAARKAGIPDRNIRPYVDLWNTPGWKWSFQHVLDGVLYEHGTGSSGKDAAINLAVQKRSSVVIGHVHCYGGVKWHANPFDVVFGLNCGCGIDCSAYAFAYGKAFAIRPTLGCGIIIDGKQAYFEIMPAGPGEKYHRSRAGRRRLGRTVRKLIPHLTGKK